MSGRLPLPLGEGVIARCFKTSNFLMDALAKEEGSTGGRPSERDKTYFGYYGMLMHQQNMLLDSIRTLAYSTAVSCNAADFKGKVVLDVGAGTGILSFFAAKAGARKVYAVEASEMADHARRLVEGNGMAGVIEVIKGKVEEVELDEMVDVIISEPMGVFLVHERMVESFIIARDRFLRKAGPQEVLPSQMYPSSGCVYLAPFTDIALYAETISKISFWSNRDFYGVDLTPVLDPAAQNQFSQAIVGPFDHKTLVSQPAVHRFDFTSASVEELRLFTIPFQLTAESTGLVHGMAGWFDVLFAGSQELRQLTTSPSSETTHWYQVRFLLSQPIAINRGQTLSGEMRLSANDQRSCDISLSVHLDGTQVTVEQTYALQNQQYSNLSPPASLGIPQEALGIYSNSFY